MKIKILILLIIQILSSLTWAAPHKCMSLFDTHPAEIPTENKLDALRVAAVQFPLAEGRSAEDFLAKMKIFIDEAKQNGAQLVVFPELITTELVDWKSNNETEQLVKIAQEFTPRYIEWLKHKSHQLNISILGGTTPRLVDGKIFNSAVLALPDGKVILQDKVFLTPDEKKWNWTAGQDFKAFDTPWGKTAITTCFDCEFPIISQMMAKAQPEVILVPSWTSTESGLNRVDWTAKSRAIEHFSFVIKTGTVPDPKSAQIHFGKAGIITPQDQGFPAIPIEGKLNEASIIYGNLDLKLLRERRKTTGYYPAQEQGQRAAPINFMNDGL